MKNFISTYKNFSFQERTIFNARFTIIFNFIIAISKIIISFFYGIFFLVTALVNIFLGLARLECYMGVKFPYKKSFTYRNRMISILMIVAGVFYSIYMGRLIFTDISLMKYSKALAIIIACVSFVELTVAVKGIFNAIGKGHYYRNIKLISFSSALIAIVLTEVALMVFSVSDNTRLTSGIFGISVGSIIILLAIFVLLAPKVSLVDRKFNKYELASVDLLDDDVIIPLRKSRFYSSYHFSGYKSGNVVEGYIVKEKNPFWNLHIVLKIIFIIFSEILIFGYGIGALVNYFSNGKIIKNLNSYMLKHGYIKVE